MVWKQGPLPPNTYEWGGVVKCGQDPSGFYFADFCGDHVKIIPGEERVDAKDIAWYDNCLTLPDDRKVNVKGRAP